MKKKIVAKKAAKKKKAVKKKKQAAKKTSKKAAKKASKRGAKRGEKRAEKWKDSFVALAELVFSRGEGPADLAIECKCSLATIYRWLKEKPEFGAAVDLGESRFLDGAEALYKIGAIREATPRDEVTKKVKVGKDVDDKDVTETETTTKQGVFKLKTLGDLLKRRRPGKWGDKAEEQSGFTFADLAAAAGEGEK